MRGAMPQALFGAYYSQWQGEACPLADIVVRPWQGLLVSVMLPPRSQSRIDTSTKWFSITIMNYVMDVRAVPLAIQ
jgi:hypothetical protein